MYHTLRNAVNVVRTRRGFTLIELLVVVLIIAILAAVAVPQYQKAAEKARMTEIVSWISSFNKAFQLYVDTNGHPDANASVAIFSQNENLLDIDLPYIGISVFWGDGYYDTNALHPKDGIRITGSSYKRNNGKFGWGCMDCNETGYCQRLSKLSNGLIGINPCY